MVQLKDIRKELKYGFSNVEMAFQFIIGLQQCFTIASYLKILQQLNNNSLTLLFPFKTDK